MVDELIETLKNGDEVRRREAAHKLGSIKSDKGLRALIDAFSDESWLVREMAVESILTIGDESGVAMFLTVLKDTDARVRNSAVKILTGLGDLALDALSKSLEDEDDNTVRYSADCIGDIGNKKGLKPLLGALARSKGDSRYYIILALGKMKESSAIDALLPCLDEDMWIQTAALEALGDIGDSKAVDKILEVMEKEFFVVSPASDALGKIGDVQAIPVLLANLENDNDEIVASSAKALVSIKEKNSDFDVSGFSSLGINGEVVSERLISTLASEDSEARGAAAVLLGWLKAEGAVKPLTKLLGDEDYDVSKQAGETLAELGPASVDSLSSFIDIPEKRAKLLAIKALEEIDDDRALKFVMRTLEEDDEDLKIASINLLGKIGGDGVFERLRDFLEDYSELIRSAAVKAIVGIKPDKGQCGQLLDSLVDANPMLKRSIAEIMGLLKVEEAKEEMEKLLLDSDSNVKQATVFALAEIEGREGIGSIPIMLLGSDDPVLRKSAAIVLGKLADQRGVQPLLLTAQDSDPWVRYHSVQSLRSLKDTRALTVLKKTVEDPLGAVRIVTLKALLDIAPDEIDEELISFSEEEDEDVRQAFIEVLSLSENKIDKAVFLEGVKDVSWKVRESAVRGLGKYDDEESLEQIKKMTEDNNLFVKEAAKRMLEQKEN